MGGGINKETVVYRKTKEWLALSYFLLFVWNIGESFIKKGSEQIGEAKHIKPYS